MISLVLLLVVAINVIMKSLGYKKIQRTILDNFVQSVLNVLSRRKTYYQRVTGKCRKNCSSANILEAQRKNEPMGEERLIVTSPITTHLMGAMF